MRRLSQPNKTVPTQLRGNSRLEEWTLRDVFIPVELSTRLTKIKRENNPSIPSLRRLLLRRQEHRDALPPRLHHPQRERLQGSAGTLLTQEHNPQVPHYQEGPAFS